MVQIIFLAVLRVLIVNFLLLFNLIFSRGDRGFHEAFLWLVRDIEKFKLLLLGLHTSLYRLGDHIHA